jgi:hypothetical protein
MPGKKKPKAASVAAINVTSKTGNGRGSHPKKVPLVESELESALPLLEGETPPTAPSSGAVPPQTERMNESTIELWKSVFDFEKNRYSFFDELFTQGHVVDRFFFILLCTSNNK